MRPEEPIQFVYADRTHDQDSKFFGDSNAMIARVADLDTDIMAGSLSRLCAEMDRMFDSIGTESGPFQLSSFEVTVELTGSGEVRLIGAVSVEVKGGIRLIFDRRDRHPS